jgi:hypothetical protein
VGTATSAAVLTSPSPYSVIRTSPAAAIAARNRGPGRDRPSAPPGLASSLAMVAAPDT